jgi:hypothetical protein
MRGAEKPTEERNERTNPVSNGKAEKKMGQVE